MMTDAIDAATPALDPRRWLALVVLLVGAFLGPLDFFIVNVAMPSIAGGLRASPSEIQLVISGYAVVYAVFLITGGRLGDLFGRKRMFLIGLAGFAVASAMCGLAWSADVLIASRLLQALAGAAMAPQALATVHALFPPHERGRALTIYSATIGLASVAGQLLGGMLVSADLDGLGWRLIFLINLPISLAAFAAAIPLVQDTRSARRPRLDWLGMLLSAAALSAFIVPLIEGRERGWPWWCIALLLSAAVFGELFRRWEIRLARRGGEPLVAMDIFRAPGLLRGLGAIGTLYAMAAFFLTYSIYLQAGLGRTALQAGIGIVPFSAGLLTGSFTSGIVGRWAGVAASSLGFLVSAAGMVATAQLVAAMPGGVAPPTALLWLTLAITGLGMGTSIPTMVRVVVERVEQHRAGLVGGLVNTMLQISAGLGVAVLGGLFFTVRGDRTDPQAIATAFAVTMVSVAGAHLLGAALAAGLGQRRGAAVRAGG